VELDWQRIAEITIAVVLAGLVIACVRQIAAKARSMPGQQMRR
jgi:hypothetical protein